MSLHIYTITIMDYRKYYYTKCVTLLFKYSHSYSLSLVLVIKGKQF